MCLLSTLQSTKGLYTVCCLLNYLFHKTKQNSKPGVDYSNILICLCVCVVFCVSLKSVINIKTEFLGFTSRLFSLTNSLTELSYKVQDIPRITGLLIRLS